MEKQPARRHGIYSVWKADFEEEARARSEKLQSENKFLNYNINGSIDS